MAKLRLSTMLVAVISVLIALAGNQRIGGMEWLMVFLLVFVTLVPMSYFGLHCLLGRLMTPRLSSGESAWVAFSELLFVFAPAALISMINPLVHSLAHAAP